MRDQEKSPKESAIIVNNSKSLFSFTRLIYPVLVFICLIFLWELICSILEIAPYILPAPHIIFLSIIDGFSSLIRALLITLSEAMAGFIVAVLFGFLAGCIFAHSRTAEYSFYPYVITLKAVPIIAIAPILVTWFGDDIFSKIMMAAIVSFFPVVVNMAIGLRAVNEQEMLLLKSFSASRWQIFTKLRLPNSLPYLLSAIKLASTMSILGAIVAEFVGSKQGIGFVILLATYHLETARLFAAIFLTALASVAIFMTINYIEKIVLSKFRFFT